MTKLERREFLDNSNFMLDTEEMALARSKSTAKNKIAFAVMLKFFQIEGRYPNKRDIISQSMLDSVMVQLNCLDVNFDNYDWEGRTTERFRKEIRALLGYKRPTSSDITKLSEWFVESVFLKVPTLPQAQEKAYEFFAKNKLEPLSVSNLDICISRPLHNCIKNH